MGISSALGSSALVPAGFGFRNKIINGGMAIAQRGSSSVSNGAASSTYGGPDRWHIFGSSASKMTIEQSTTVPSGSGFTNSLLVTSSAATTPGASDYYGVRQHLEGTTVADLAFGTSGAKQITISFWVRSSIAGTYSVTIHNSGVARAYINTYSISSANTWEFKTVYVTGDTAGTWPTDAGEGMSLWFDLGSGSNSQGSAGVWNTGADTRTSDSVNFVGTNGATFYLTGVQLEQNNVPTNFEFRHRGVELSLCQRYFTRLTDPHGSGTYYATGSIGSRIGLFLPTTMRAKPTVTSSGTFGFWNGNSTATQSTLYTAFSSLETIEVEFSLTGSGFTGGQAIQMYIQDTTSNYINCNSEL